MNKITNQEFPARDVVYNCRRADFETTNQFSERIKYRYATRNRVVPPFDEEESGNAEYLIADFVERFLRKKRIAVNECEELVFQVDDYCQASWGRTVWCCVNSIPAISFELVEGIRCSLRDQLRFWRVFLYSPESFDDGIIIYPNGAQIGSEYQGRNFKRAFRKWHDRHQTMWWSERQYLFRQISALRKELPALIRKARRNIVLAKVFDNVNGDFSFHALWTLNRFPATEFVKPRRGAQTFRHLFLGKRGNIQHYLLETPAFYLKGWSLRAAKKRSFVVKDDIGKRKLRREIDASIDVVRDEDLRSAHQSRYDDL